jgi:hypothetical protein
VGPALAMCWVTIVAHSVHAQNRALFQNIAKYVYEVQISSSHSRKGTRLPGFHMHYSLQHGPGATYVCTFMARLFAT